MEIVSGRVGKPHVTSQQFRQILEGIIGKESYIIDSGECLEPELASNNILKIRSGAMSHHGNISSVKIGTYDEVELTNGSQGMKRIDLVVNRYTRNAETGIESNDWVVIMGIPSEDAPAVPEYTVGNLQEDDLKDDCPVFEIHYDGLNVTEVKKLLDVADNLGKMKTELAELNGKMLNQNLTLSGLSAYSGRVSLNAGGYYKIGNIVIVQLTYTGKTALTAGNYWTLFQGLPKPVCPVACADFIKNEPHANFIGEIHEDGVYILHNTSAISKGDVHYMAACYIAVG